MKLTVASLSVAIVVLLIGCGTSGDFPTAPTSGRVVCEGQPVPHVMVFFEPLQSGKAALVGKQGIGRAKEDGTFAVSTYGDGDGAVVGPHRVRVGPPRGDLHPGFKCACMLNSEVDVMQVEIKKGEKNQFDVVLKKGKSKEPLPFTED